MNERILIVDDEATIRQTLEVLLKRDGYDISMAKNGEEALAQAKNANFDLIVSDLRMPKVDGLQLLDRVKVISPDTVFVMMTAHGTAASAVEAMKKGAYEYVLKPFQLDEIRLVVKSGLERRRLRDENLELRKTLSRTYSFQNMVGVSNAMLDVFKLIEKVATVNSNVLITGASGTGKEMVAKAIHYGGTFKDSPFVAVNCGAIPDNLLESELFGHKRGAFTGAVSDKKGLFEMADQGTLFLDEVGELPLNLQVKLLRALQENAIRRLGDVRDVTVDVRIIAATNKDLDEAVTDGQFREDLYYRLNVIEIRLPGLNERPDDIPHLADHFLGKYREKLNKNIKTITKEAMNALLGHTYRGNVRELENMIERAVALETTDAILPESLRLRSAPSPAAPPPAGSTPEPGAHFDLEAHLHAIERELIEKALEKTGGKKKKAAALLGITFRSIRYRMEKLGMD